MTDSTAPRGQRTREQIEQVMRRVGMADRIPEARRTLPDVVDRDRDAALLLRLALSIDRVANQLGTGPW